MTLRRNLSASCATAVPSQRAADLQSAVSAAQVALARTQKEAAQREQERMYQLRFGGAPEAQRPGLSVAAAVGGAPRRPASIHRTPSEEMLYSGGTAAPGAHKSSGHTLILLSTTPVPRSRAAVQIFLGD